MVLYVDLYILYRQKVTNIVLLQILTTLVAIATAEPPSGYSYSPPSTSYGAPSGGGGGFGGGFGGGSGGFQGGSTGE